MQSLDGYVEGPNGNLDWHAVDEEYNDFSVEQLNAADTLLFGRKTYELMSSYWTSDQAQTNDPVIAEKMCTMQKMVCSSTQQHFDWNNSFWVGESVPEAICSLKKQQGKNILIYGSITLAKYLAQHNLIDEFCIILNPVYLGSGKTLMNMIPEYVHLQLTETYELVSGKIVLRYKPLTKQQSTAG